MKFHVSQGDKTENKMFLEQTIIANVFKIEIKETMNQKLVHTCSNCETFTHLPTYKQKLSLKLKNGKKLIVIR
jgi:hypothetical protein